MKKRSKDIYVYNMKLDPLKRIREYEYDSSIGKPRLIKDTIYKYDNQFKLIDTQITNYEND